jgi:hypothetical protein
MNKLNLCCMEKNSKKIMKDLINKEKINIYGL